MGLDIKYGTGQTPINEDEKDELIPFWVTNNEDLNKVEQQNINKALLEFGRRNFEQKKVLSLPFVKYVHKKMFEDVWNWAGLFRTTDKNIGISKYQITTCLYALLQDVKYWILHRTYGLDELAIRCKHKMVSIHPFPNGNGRHSRVFADILIKLLGNEAFTWGASLQAPRKKYLASLRKADAGSYHNLIKFSRS